MEAFIQQLINGITLGSIYGLIAIGYTMVFGIIGMVNFAHGDVFMVSAFIAVVTFLLLTTWLGIGSIALALLIVLIVAMLLTSLVNWTVEEARRLQIRRLFALTYEQGFFNKLGFDVVDKDALPLKVWSDCVRCPKRDGCDEIAMIRELTDVPMIVMPAAPPTPKGVSIPVLEEVED